jgi:tetratricopeptide (TPR) repeat protein
LELGLIFNKIGRSREAEKYLRDALEIRTRLLPAGNPLIAVSEGALGECLTTKKRYAEAEPFLQRSYTIIKTVQGDRSAGTLEAIRRMVTLYQAWGRPAEAARYQAALPQTTPSRTTSHTP